MKPEEEEQYLVGISDELNRRLHNQARNLLIEYRLAGGVHSGCVPHEIVERLMKLYGQLIVRLIYEDQKRATRNDKKAIENES